MEVGDQGMKDEGTGRRTWSGDNGDEKEPHQLPQADSDDDDEGTRQPYNCTFCRRGFPTAQALGGHMNVHRKDRPGIRASTAPAAKTTALMGYGLAPDPAAGGSLLHAERAPQELRLFGRVVDGAGAGRGREHGGAYGDRRDQYYSVEEGRDGEQEEEELDLELRLGAAGQ